MSSEENAMNVEEHLYKVLVIGEFGVGKTSIIRRYTEGTFSPNYKLTIGVDFALKSIKWNDNTKINLQLWYRVYYKYAIAAIIVYDLSRPATFESVLKWFTDVNQKVMLANEQPVPILLIANKSDLLTNSLDEASLDTFCKQHNFIGWYTTSAKDNKNIDQAMHFLVETILSLTSNGQQPEEHISLHQDTNYLQTIEEEEYNANSSCCSKN
ncbi:ras-related protein Rab-32B-like [Anneissia japonica]|uniref:ras-related protein Rab-32B-like n=1 Tax=Anneissia japonica TaxID=1529436 RepID=UPI001425A3D1|nr:ras-related protein Rab-32B-like [Anneissia japonica]